MQRIVFLLAGFPVALAAQESAGTELWRLAATTLVRPAALAAGGTAAFWNPAQPLGTDRAAFGLDAIETSSAVGGSGLLAVGRLRVRPVGVVGQVYGRMNLTDLVHTTLSPDPDAGTIPFYTETVGATWAGARGGTVVGAALAFHYTHLEFEQEQRLTFDLRARHAVHDLLEVAVATHFFSRFALSDAAQDVYAGIQGRAWRGPMWQGGGVATIRARYGVTLTRGFTSDHQFGAGVELGDALSSDLLVVREGGFAGARWRFVAGIGLVIGRYRISVAETPGVSDLGAAYRVGLETRVR